MDYQLVFSPDLGLDPETFVDDWNEDHPRKAAGLALDVEPLAR